MTEERKELTNEEKLQRRIDWLECDRGSIDIEQDGSIEFPGFDGKLHPKTIAISISGKYVPLDEVIRCYKALAELIRIAEPAKLIKQ